ncbi:MAG TPA: hypothetical protein VFE50_05215 [Cyclobacteriaceae bacterium]|nr:hypothetical protein [Cyclobacteriaceae bacterium]
MVRVLKKIFRGFLIFLAVLVALAASMVGGIDRTPLKEQEFYQEMMGRLDTTRLIERGGGQLRSGWTKVNITPSAQMPMAGYMPRDHFDAVHDSLYARILVFDNGSFRCAMINVDLLIFPPKLRDKLYDLNNDNIFLYLSATHTHNGVGGWDPSPGGRLVTGSYSEEWMNDVAARIDNAIAGVVLKDASIQYWQAPAEELIENRVNVDSGKVDGSLRGLKVQRTDSSSAILFTYGAHSTSIQSDILELSADYPGKTIKLLEEQNSFAMFMSGMVGSHRFRFTFESSYDFIDMMGPTLVSKIRNAKYDSTMSSPDIRSAHIPIEFGPSQLRIDRNWKVNNWVFRLLFRKLQGEFTYLEFGNVVFIGTPCDFSGEIYALDSLESFATKRGKHLVITSFNGDYDGYITYDKHYENSRKEEINALNWVGPYYGAYFSEMIQKIVDK